MRIPWMTGISCPGKETMSIPYDILRAHVFPLLPIDTRLAFKVPPRRIPMEPYEAGPLGDAFRRRYNLGNAAAFDAVTGPGTSRATVPLLTLPCNDPPEWHWYYMHGHQPWHYPAKVFIHYHYDHPRYKGKTYIEVIRVDDRGRPRFQRKPGRILARMCVTDDGYPDVIYSAPGAQTSCSM